MIMKISLARKGVEQPRRELNFNREGGFKKWVVKGFTVISKPQILMLIVKARWSNMGFKDYSTTKMGMSSDQSRDNTGNSMAQMVI